MRYFWAAYQMGMWSDLFQENLNRGQFQNSVYELLGSCDMEWVLEVPAENGLRPVGIVVADFRFMGNGIEPHVDWFPWATARNRLEASLTYLKEVGKRYKVFIYATAPNQRFWEHVHRYNVLKKGCKITDCYGAGDDAMMYYTPGPFV